LAGYRNAQALLEATNFVASIERRQGLKIASPQEIAYRRGLIDEEQLMRLAKPLLQTEYGQYLMKLVLPVEVHQRMREAFSSALRRG
jgi:dTDP-glucose pyrophosphorylase